MSKYKILIIEDEKQISRFLKLELEHEGYEVSAEFDGRLGLENVQNNVYDLILLDIMLPGLNGIEVCRRIRQFSDIPIIIVTAKDQLTDKILGLDIGADDYITKPFQIEEILARIRVILRRKNVNSTTQEKLTIDDLTLNITTHEVYRDNKLISLSKKEFDLLEYLLKNINIVLSRDKIVENVWGYEYSGDTNVVDVYIKYLREKVENDKYKKLIHTVRGVGYVVKDGKNEN